MRLDRVCALDGLGPRTIVGVLSVRVEEACAGGADCRPIVQIGYARQRRAPRLAFGPGSRADWVALGARLAGLRVAAGHTQEVLARATFYGRSSIANIETGRQRAPREFWARCDTVLASDGSLVDQYDRIVVGRS